VKIKSPKNKAVMSVTEKPTSIVRAHFFQTDNCLTKNYITAPVTTKIKKLKGYNQIMPIPAPSAPPNGSTYRNIITKRGPNIPLTMNAKIL